MKTKKKIKLEKKNQKGGTCNINFDKGSFDNNFYNSSKLKKEIEKNSLFKDEDMGAKKFFFESIDKRCRNKEKLSYVNSMKSCINIIKCLDTSTLLDLFYDVISKNESEINFIETDGKNNSYTKKTKKVRFSNNNNYSGGANNNNTFNELIPIIYFLNNILFRSIIKYEQIFRKKTKIKVILQTQLSEIPGLDNNIESSMYSEILPNDITKFTFYKTLMNNKNKILDKYEKKNGKKNFKNYM